LSLSFPVMTLLSKMFGYSYNFCLCLRIVKLSVVKKNAAVQVWALESKPEYFAQVAQWHHQECERQGLHSTLALRQQRLLLHVQKNAVPKTFMLLRDDELLGCVSLVNYTYRSSERMPKVNSESPLWLSNLFVNECERQQGYGNFLIEAAKKYARNLQHYELWLIASDYTDYYEKRGWLIERKTRLGGRQINVMRIALKSDSN